MTTNGSEAAAIQILTRAVQLDSENKYSESMTCYEQGIRLLLQALKETTSEEKKLHFNKKVKEYLGRAEIMKMAFQKERDSFKEHKQIRIGNNESGFSYEKVFTPFIDEFLSSVEVEDAYIRSTHQIYNFLHFCELLVKKATQLKNIILHTTYCTENASLQEERLEEIKRSLATYDVTLKISFSETLHDREIRFNNGWIMKIGRGLDYFKRSSGRFSIGFADFDLRPCHETTIDIFHKKAILKS